MWTESQCCVTREQNHVTCLAQHFARCESIILFDQTRSSYCRRKAIEIIPTPSVHFLLAHFEAQLENHRRVPICAIEYTYYYSVHTRNDYDHHKKSRRRITHI